nr:MAG TPA: hypothetical protein [Caudoviricetes sp.]
MAKFIYLYRRHMSLPRWSLSTPSRIYDVYFVL